MAISSILMWRFSLLILVITTPAAGAEPVTAVAYHPDGKSLAVGQGSRVHLFDASGKPLAKIDAIPGRITTLAFSANGSHLAVAAGDAGQAGLMDVYPVAKDSSVGPRVLRLAKAHTDSIYGLAFSPGGKLLATAGYDRVIHLWPVVAGTTMPLRTLKDHSDTIYALAFHPEGKRLASVSADRTVKVWDVDSGARLYTLSEPTDWQYAVAWSPDGRFVAAGGVDRSLRVWQADATAGKLVKSAFAHERPVTRLAFTSDGQKLFSLGEDRVIKAWDAASLKEAAVFPAQKETVLGFALRPDGKQVAVGRHDGVAELLDATGKRMTTLLLEEKKAQTDRFRTVPEAAAATDSARKAMPITRPVTVLGSIDRPGDVDYFRFSAKAGEEIGIEAALHDAASRLDPVLTLTDESGRVLAEGAGTLGFIAPADGSYAIGLRDRDFQGGADRKYHLSVGPIPVVNGVFPLGVTRGRSSRVQLLGVNLGKTTTVMMDIPTEAKTGSRVPVTLPRIAGETVLGMPTMIVDEFPSSAISADGQTTLTATPATVDGVLAKADEAHTIRFPARRGARLVIEVNAHRLGSPLDSTIEILDRNGKPMPLAVLRCTAKTFTSLRDHDAEKPGIRLETWHDFRIDDFLYADGELMRIVELPRGPDDDCLFYQVNGKRVGYRGTTPTFHPFGVTVYRVDAHPPGTTFPPNGMPVYTLYQRNDDGGPGLGADSKLFFDPPADGEYQVRIRDSRGAGGTGYAYRLTVREPRPDYAIRFTPTAPEVWRGGAVPINVTVDRFDDFDGPIHVELQGLPEGFHAPSAVIAGNLNTTTIAMSATENAVIPRSAAPLKMIAKAVIADREVSKEALGKPVALASTLGDLATSVQAPEVAIRPGHEARFTVAIERRNGFKGRVPITVAGLPHGVRVMNVGLNGILITERDTSREVVLYAEPWVKPTTNAFVVFAKREGKTTEHAAPSVRLRIE